MGEWDWSLAQLEEAVATSEHDYTAQMRLAELLGLRGHDTEAELARLAEMVADITEYQNQAAVAESQGVVALAGGEFAQALAYCQKAYRINLQPGSTSVATAIRAAAALGDASAVSDALGAIEGYPGRAESAERREGEAVLTALDGRRAEATAAFHDAIRQWQELGFDVEAALAKLTMLTVLGLADAGAREAADEAREVFDRVGAQPFVDRLAAVTSAVDAPASRSSDRVTEGRPASPA
jgi:tetratricopeptide (TPR) repeat protein